MNGVHHRVGMALPHHVNRVTMCYMFDDFFLLGMALVGELATEVRSFDLALRAPSPNHFGRIGLYLGCRSDAPRQDRKVSPQHSQPSCSRT